MYPQNCYPGFNPYNQVQSAGNFMQPQQSPSYARPMIIGKVVNRVEDVTPNDIPMDGSYGVFPIQDRSCIYLKRWNADGTISTEKYLKEVIDIPKEPERDPIDEKLTTIQFDIDQLIEAFARIEKSFKAKPTSTKKEVAVNE